MKKIKNLLLVGLTSVSLLGMAGCRHDEPEEEQQEQKNDDPAVIDECPGINAIAGAPMAALSSENRSKIVEFVRKIDEDISDRNFNEVFDKLDQICKGVISNEAVAELISLVERVYSKIDIADGIDGILNADISDAEFKSYVYTLLSVAKSIPTDKILDILDTIAIVANEEYDETELGGYLDAVLAYKDDELDYVMHGMNGEEYKELKAIEKDQNNPDFQRLTQFIEKAETLRNNIEISPKVRKAFEAYKDFRKGSLKFAGGRELEFSKVYKFMEAHLKLAKMYGMQTVKGIVDAVPLSLIKNLVNDLKGGNIGFEKKFVDKKMPQFEVNTMPAILNFVKDNKATLIKVLKTVASEDLFTILLDGFNEFADLILPETYTEKGKQLMETFKNKVKKVSAKELVSIVNFICALLEKVDVQTMVDFVLGDIEANIVPMVQYLAPILKDVVAATSGADKDNINKVLGILGIDLFEYAQRVIDIHEKADYDTDGGKKKVATQIMSLGQEVMGIAMGYMPVGDPEDALEEYEELHKYDSKVESIVLAKNSYKFGEVPSLDNINVSVKYFVDSESLEDTKEEVNVTKTAAQLKAELTNFDCTITDIDTTKPGYKDYVITVTFDGQTYNKTGTLVALPKAEDTPIFKNHNNGVAYLEDGIYPMYRLHSVVKVPDTDIVVDTSKEGKQVHFYYDELENTMHYFLYEVYNDNEENIVFKTYGTPFAWKDDDEFYDQFRVAKVHHYKDLIGTESSDFKITKSSHPEIDFSDTGKHTMTVEALDHSWPIEYEIVDPKACPVDYYKLDFEEIFDKIGDDPVTEEISYDAFVSHKYKDEHNAISKAEAVVLKAGKLRLSNLTYDADKGILEFEYNGRTYSFTEGDDD